jgi:hypothetical protein
VSASSSRTGSNDSFTPVDETTLSTDELGLWSKPHDDAQDDGASAGAVRGALAASHALKNDSCRTARRHAHTRAAGSWI